jgi:hypothetical protein
MENSSGAEDHNAIFVIGFGKLGEISSISSEGVSSAEHESWNRTEGASLNHF